MKRTLYGIALGLLLLGALCAARAESPYSFELNADGKSYALTAVGGQTGTESIAYAIPSEYEGLPVTVIGSGAFQNLSIRYIQFPKQLEAIESRAFADADVGSMHFPSTITKIAPDAIENAKIDTLVLPAKFPESVFHALHNAASIYSLSLSSDCTDYTRDLGTGLIYSADKTRLLFNGQNNGSNDVYPIPNTVTTIGKYAFAQGMKGKYYINIGPQVTTIEEGALLCANMSGVHLKIFAEAGSAIAKYAEKHGLPTLTHLPGMPGEMELSLNENGGYTVTNVTNYFSSNVDIPASVGGIPITEIGESAFAYRTFSSIRLPEGVVSIGKSAFMGCTILQEGFALPQSLETIGDSAFREFTSPSFALPAHVTSIGESAFEKFQSPDAVLAIPEGVTYLPERVFHKSAFKELWLPDSLPEFSPGWFIANSLGSYARPAFSIRISDHHPSMVMTGGVLFSRNGAILYYSDNDWQSGMGAYTVPEGVEQIMDCAFCDTHLARLCLGDTVRAIGDYAFSNCDIISLTMGGNVRSIGANAFCENGIAAIEFPSLITMGAGAFSNNPLVSIDVPLLQTMGANALSYTSLVAVEFPSLRTMGNSAMDGCDHLQAVMFSADIQSITGNAFYRSQNQNQIVLYGYDGYLLEYATLQKLSYVSLLTPATSDFQFRKYSVSGLQQYAVTGTTSSATSLVLPAVYEGMAVTMIESGAFEGMTGLKSVRVPSGFISIGEGAFSGCSQLTGVTLPDTLLSIDNFAFEGCAKLSKITLPKSLQAIGAGAFSGCDALTAINVASGSKVFKSASGVLLSADGQVILAYPAMRDSRSYTNKTALGVYPYAFSGAKKLTNVNLPNMIIVGDMAFYNCKPLSSASFGAALTTIGTGAFTLCESLKSFQIPQNVHSISGAPFISCPTAVTVNAGNTNFCAVDGALYSADQTRLVYYPSTATAAKPSLPESVIEIGDYAFAGNPYIQSASLPRKLRRLGDGAFSLCVNLKNVSIPPRVTDMGSDVFEYCPSDLTIACEYLSVAAKYAQKMGHRYAYESYCVLLTPGITELYLTVGECARLERGYSSNYDCVSYSVFDGKCIQAYAAGDTTIDYSIGYSHYRLTLHIVNEDERICLDERITALPEGVFAGCTAIRRVEIPSSVASIAPDAFKDCAGITIVCEQGSYAESFARERGYAVMYRP